MKKTLTTFLQIVVLVIGVVALAFLIWMPTVEGRNINATLFEIYFNDPFLAFVYVGSNAYFVGVYKMFQVLGYARQNEFYSWATVKALRTIKYCAFVIIGFVVIGEIYIMTSISDDRAGGVAMGIFIIFGSVVVVAVATMAGRKSQNNLTV